MSDSALVEANQRLCDDCIALLAALDANLYQQAPPPYASIGAHVRHIIEFYQCLFDGVQHQQLIDYDHRPRNTCLSSDTLSAVQALQHIQSQLVALTHLSQTVKVHETVSVNVKQPFHVTSTVARELLFLHAHTMHHFSSIKAIAFALGISFDANFGKAPSTIAYEKTQAAD